MFKKSPEHYIKALSFYQVSSGIYGLFKLIASLSQYELKLVIELWEFVVPQILLYILYSASGILLYKRNNLGFKLSIISYLFQAVHLRINGFEFICTMFTNIFLYYYYPWSFGPGLQIGGEASIFFYNDTSINYIGINVISIVAIYLLHKIKSVEDYPTINKQ